MSGNTFDNLPADKRHRVLEAAEDEFAEHGFHQASINRIVRRLGIAKGSLFQYFGSKEGLFEHLFHNSLEELKRPLREAEASGEGFFSKVRGTMLAGLAFIDDHPRLYRIYLKLLFQENAPLRDKLLGIVARSLEGYLEPIIDRARSEGEIRPDADTSAVLFLIQAVLERFLQGARVPGVDASLFGVQGEEASRRIDAVVNLLRQGLGPCPN
ncbi:MAG: TetR/AcrR family transcriptional regulator [Desulfovibrionaceae bacterium]